MDKKVAYIPFSFPGLPNVRCAFGYGPGPCGLGPGNISLRAGDKNEALENRRGMKAALGFSGWRSLAQVHGTDMVYDSDEDTLETGGRVQADGLATSKTGDALVIKTADCQPILLASRDGAVVAALHAGWRGNVANFPGKGVAEICARYGLSPKDLMAVRGPSLGPSASEFTRFDEEFGEAFRPYYNDTTQTVDLWRLTRDQLVRAGLSPENVFSVDLCTHSLGEFFSYRRDRTAGRQAAFIWKTV